jgi:hypothetical protein
MSCTGFIVLLPSSTNLPKKTQEENIELPLKILISQ